MAALGTRTLKAVLVLAPLALGLWALIGAWRAL
jgi:hypothetical protein